MQKLLTGMRDFGGAATQQEKLSELEAAIAADYNNIAGMVVLKNGETVYENYKYKSNPYTKYFTRRGLGEVFS